MDDIAAFSYKGGSGFRPSGNGFRLAVFSFLFLNSFLFGGATWAAASHRLMAAGENAFGILPMSLGKPSECHFESVRALNGGSYSDGLLVVGDAYCPTDQGTSESFPYVWTDGSWVRMQTLEDRFYDWYIVAVSEDPAQPVMLNAVRRLEGGGPSSDGLALLVADAGQEPVELAPLSNMRFVVGRAAISANGNVVVAHSAAGDWEAGYTYRAVRWIRAGDSWSAPEDIGEGTAISASADGRVIVGNGDGEDSGATGGKGWIWVADGDGGGNVTSLGDDSRVVDITHSGSMVIGSRPQPCDPDAWCEFFPVPVYWVQEGGQWVMHDLQTGSGDVNAIAVAEIDGQPVILGEWLFSDTFTMRAGVWLPDENGAFGAPLMLETIGANPDSLAFAYDINKEGIVLGWSELKPWGDGSSVLWSLRETLPFRINPGIGDAWYNPETSGQGFFINVWEDIQMMFVGWFTYGTGASDGSHYWMTAQGPYSDNAAELEITLSSGGAFVSPQPSPEQTPDGTMTLEFTSCLEGTVSYDIPSTGRQGTISIRRLTHDQVFYCESRSVPGAE